MIHEFSDYISGQCSDGWCESFEQQPVLNNFTVSTWDKDDENTTYLMTKKVD